MKTKFDALVYDDSREIRLREPKSDKIYRHRKRNDYRRDDSIEDPIFRNFNRRDNPKKSLRNWR